jgi:predicted site-specific integrase-resolvase
MVVAKHKHLPFNTPTRPEDGRELLKRCEVAWLLNVSVATLEQWANAGKGPPHFLIGGGSNDGVRTYTDIDTTTGKVRKTVRRAGAARYRRSEVEKWVASQERRTSDGE